MAVIRYKDRQALIDAGCDPSLVDQAIRESRRTVVWPPAGQLLRMPKIIIPGEPRFHSATSGQNWWEAVWIDWPLTSKNVHKQGIRAWCRARSRDDVVLSWWRRHPDGPPDATGCRRVTVAVERQRAAGRLGDPQNLEESVYDSLVKAGLLVDDDSRYLDRGPTTIVVNREIEWKWRTTIRIEDI